MPNPFIDELDLQSPRIFRFLTGGVFLTIGIGTVFYHFVEGWSWIDSYYFSVVTLATVGFGDLAPKTDLGKIFTTFYIFAGVGMLAAYFGLLVRRRWATRIERRFGDEVHSEDDKT